MSAQPDMFCGCGRVIDTAGRDVCFDCYCSQQDREPEATTTNSLIGLRVKLDRPVDRERPCCRNICTIGAARGPHAAELICSDWRPTPWLAQQIYREMARNRRRQVRRAGDADHHAPVSLRGGAPTEINTRT